MSITSACRLDNNGRPEQPWEFARALEASQPTTLKHYYNHKVLFNKGRYFETSVYESELRNKISELSGIPISYNTMFVGNWSNLEDFVIAMNICGYRVSIDVDWI
jgi:hypothetical protein